MANEQTDAQPSLAPAEEIGYVNPHGVDSLHWDDDEKIPELQWPNSVHVYKRMDSEDGRVSSVLQAIGLPIRRTPWRIEPNGARDEVVEFVSRNLGLPISGADEAIKLTKPRVRGRFSWGQHLQQTLLMMRYGHQFFEQTYRIVGLDTPNPRALLRNLSPRPSQTLSKIKVARNGGLISIVQSPAVDGPLTVDRMIAGGDEIPVSRLVAYVRDPDPGEWVGRSLLRPAYKHWLLKDELMKIQAVAARRNGIGVPDYMAPPGATQKDIDAGQKLASRYRAGETSGLSRAHGSEFKLQGVQGNLPDIQRIVEYHDKQIALAGLAHFLNLDRGGSYALASVQADTFVQSVQTFGESIRDTAQAHVVEDLVDVNFGEDEPAPLLVFDEIGSRQDLTAQSFKTLIDAGLIRIDANLEAYTRQQYGLPGADPSAPAASDSEDDQ